MSGPVSTHLDGDTLAITLVSGIHDVIDEQEFLNRSVPLARNSFRLGNTAALETRRLSTETVAACGCVRGALGAGVYVADSATSRAG